jgi:hypothetical protein
MRIGKGAKCNPEILITGLFSVSVWIVARMQPVRGASCQMRTLSRVTRHVEPPSAVPTAVSATRSAIGDAEFS